MSDSKILGIGIFFLLSLKLITANRGYIESFTDSYNQWILISIVANVIIYRYVIKIVLLRSLYEETVGKIANHIASLYYILLVGAIGSRKSSNLTAFAQMVERVKIGEMQDKIYKYKYMLYEYVDMLALEEYIYNNFDDSSPYTEEDYHDFAYKFLQDQGLDGISETYIKMESFKDGTLLTFLAEYVELFYILYYRKRHVLANTTIESVNTGYNSIPVRESLFQMYRDNDLAHEKYLTVLEDEKGVVDNARVYARMDKKSVEKNDDGKDIYTMLQRHGSKGTNTLLVVSQSELDVTANRRRLPNRFVEFLTPQDVFIFNWEIALVKYLKTRSIMKESKTYTKKMKKARLNILLYNKLHIKRFYRKAEKLIEKYDGFLDRNNKYKRRIKRYEKILIFLEKFRYIIQYSFLHESSEDIGKKDESDNNITSSIPITFVYPADITFNRYDQFSFFGIFNQRNKLATIPLSKVDSFKYKVMSKEEHLQMGYRAINRIYNEIDSQKEETTLKNHKHKTEKKAHKSEKKAHRNEDEEPTVDYSAFG